MDMQLKAPGTRGRRREASLRVSFDLCLSAHGKGSLNIIFKSDRTGNVPQWCIVPAFKWVSRVASGRGQDAVED